MEGLMLAKEFFGSISSGTHTGVVKFRNGDFAFINTKTLSTNLLGTIYTITVPKGFKESFKLEYNENWELLSKLEGNDKKLNDWDIVSAKFDDMAYIVEQVAEGKKKGYFYNALGEKIKATQDTVKLGIYYQTTRNFSIVNSKGITMYYKANLGSDVCNHSQVTNLNIIDFIEEEDD